MGILFRDLKVPPPTERNQTMLPGRKGDEGLSKPGRSFLETTTMNQHT